MFACHSDVMDLEVGAYTPYVSTCALLELVAEYRERQTINAAGGYYIAMRERAASIGTRGRSSSSSKQQQSV